MLNLPLILAVMAAIFLISVQYPLNKTLALIAFGIFLLNATTTGNDYDLYKIGYENVTFFDEPPYIATNQLDSEPIYLLYMALGRLISDEFNVFLTFCFIVWIWLNKVALGRLGIEKADLRYILLCALPVVIPVVAYWSPRSAISLPLLMLAYYFLNKNRGALGVLFGVLAGLFHSQYIPFALTLILTIVISRYFRRSVIEGAIVFSILVVGLLRFGGDTISLLFDGRDGSIFSLAFGKLHYFVDPNQTGAIRFSGLLIILMDLAYLLYFRRYAQRSIDSNQQGSNLDSVLQLIGIAAVFSIVTNILFINDAHVAGRVARFADYFVMCVGMPVVLRLVASKKLSNGIIVLYAFLSMAAFNNIYIIGSQV